jgi:signal transduction histidine kinase
VEKQSGTSFFGSSSVRTSVLVPFVIISIAFGVLAYRSHQLSVRTERGMRAVSTQYLDYAAEITARSIDAQVNAAMFQASEEWQQIERQVSIPSVEALRQWIEKNQWIVSAIYIPDTDPTEAVYVELKEREDTDSRNRLTSEFYTASGTVKYTYDAARLLERARETVRQPIAHIAHVPEAAELRDQSQIELIPTGTTRTGLVRDPERLAVVVPLAAPLDHYSVRASIRNSYMMEGIKNQRVTSILFAIVAFVLLTLGARFATRGLRREAEAMQLRSALIANVSHELRTPLSMIRLAAETLQRGGARLSSKERNDLEESVLREVLHLNHLVENVLDVARLQKSAKPLIFHPVRPDEVVQSVMNSYESWIRSKGFEVVCEIEKVEEQLWDREAIARALVNLIDNAIKYSGNDKRLKVSLKERGQAIELAVSDAGIGIRPQDIPHLFDPYFRGEFSDTQTRRGAGLGLTLVHQIVASHNGRIEVESAPGKGSTFRLLFPRTGTKQVEPSSEYLRTVQGARSPDGLPVTGPLSIGEKR